MKKEQRVASMGLELFNPCRTRVCQNSLYSIAFKVVNYSVDDKCITVQSHVL